MLLQKAYFPMKVLNISQGYGNKADTHKKSYAIDFCGKDTGKDPVYAPFDCKVSKLYVKEGHANTVWLTSLNKVLCANGYVGYMTMNIGHPEDIDKLKLRQVFKQGDLICHEGKTGYATGNHIHLELGKGTKAGWNLVKTGNLEEWVILNKVKAEDYLFLKEGTVIKNNIYRGIKYNFKYDTLEYETGTYKTLGIIKIRSGPGTNYEQKKVKDITEDGRKHVTSINLNAKASYKKGTIFDVLEIIYNNDSSIWGRGYSGYVCLRDKDGEVLSEIIKKE